MKKLAAVLLVAAVLFACASMAAAEAHSFNAPLASSWCDYIGNDYSALRNSEEYRALMTVFMLADFNTAQESMYDRLSPDITESYVLWHGPSESGSDIDFVFLCKNGNYLWMSIYVDSGNAYYFDPDGNYTASSLRTYVNNSFSFFDRRAKNDSSVMLSVLEAIQSALE